jgi:NAD(P)-dependent dehydrogenase (short-subunit alcohol dehydrogenase family)
LPVRQTIRTDMKDQASIDAALANLPEQIFALFNCAGVPSPPFAAFDTVMINFTGMRYLTERLIPRIAAGGAIAAIASTAGLAWKSNVPRLRELLAMTDFAAQAEWLRGAPELGTDCYSFSKQAMILYCMERAGALAGQEIRFNCIAPAPTATGFIDAQAPAIGGMGVYDLFKPAHGRFASPADMGRALVLLNSRLAGFISGVCLPVDFGYTAEVLSGQRDNLVGLS